MSPLTRSDHRQKTIRSDPPIFRLHVDILLHIFLMNMDVNIPSIPYNGPDETPEVDVEVLRAFSLATSPLHIARHCSQVSRSWRDLIVGSPLLWGKAIDLRALKWASDTWRNEVIRRADQSLLSITGSIDYSDHEGALYPFFMSVLDSQWHRIEKLDVTVNYGQDFESFADEEKKWQPLLRPAPDLHTCMLDIHPSTPAIFPNIRHLFSDNAPSLVRLSIPDGMTVELSPSWLPGLRALKINESSTLEHLLMALPEMPFLEHLDVSHDSPVTLLSPGLIDMPRLTFIGTKGRCQNSISLLHSIKPAPGCKLEFYTPRAPGNPFTDLEMTRQVFSRYCCNFATVVHPTRVLLSLDGDEIRLHLRTCDGSQQFTITIEFRIISAPAFALIIDSFCPAVIFGSITYLGVDHFRPPFEVLDDPTFEDFMKPLADVRMLTAFTRDIIFEYLIRPRAGDAIALPNLRVLRLTQRDFGNRWTLPFLKSRKDLERPIRLLHILQRDSEVLRRDMRSLDKMTGLKVRWKFDTIQKEYVCGSGSPEALNFVH